MVLALKAVFLSHMGSYERVVPLIHSVNGKWEQLCLRYSPVFVHQTRVWEWKVVESAITFRQAHNIQSSIHIQFLHKRHPFPVNSNNEHEIKFVLKMQFLKTYFWGTINLKGRKKESIWKRILKRIYMYLYITELLCCTLETSTTL